MAISTRRAPTKQSPSAPIEGAAATGHREAAAAEKSPASTDERTALEIILNGDLADWPEGREFAPRNQRSQTARAWFLITDAKDAGVAAKWAEVSFSEDGARKVLPALELHGGTAGKCRIEVALDTKLFLQARPNLLSFVAAGAEGGSRRSVLRRLQVTRRGPNVVDPVMTLSVDVPLTPEPRRHIVRLNKDRRDALREIATRVAADPEQSLHLAFYFNVEDLPCRVADIRMTTIDLTAKSVVTSQVQVQLVRLLAERLALRMAAARLGRGALKADRYEAFESVAHSKIKLIETTLARGGLDKVIERHFDAGEEGLDFITEGYEADWALFSAELPDPTAVFNAVLRATADCIALRHAIRSDFSKHNQAGPAWRTVLEAALSALEPQIEAQLSKVARNQALDLGPYQAGAGGRLPLYVELLKPLAPPEPVKSTAKAPPARRGAAAAGPVEAPEPTVEKAARYPGALQTDACFNDYFPVFRGQINGMERQALRERSWRTRELLALTASEGTLDYESLVAVSRRLRRIKAGPAFGSAMGMGLPHVRALTALARAAASQGLAPGDFDDAIDIYESICVSGASNHLRDIDWIQLVVLHLDKGDIAAAQAAIEASGLQTALPIEFALLASNVLRKSGEAPAPKEHLFPLNLLYRKAGLEDVRVKPGSETPFGGLGTAPIDQRVTDGPLVSVLMTTFNSEQAISVAIRSVLDQSWRNLELIIVDDCSAEENFERVKAWEAVDPRIKVLRNESNMGTYASKNRGLAIAQGEFVTCHDSDDWSHPRKLERQVEALVADEGVASFSRWVRSSPGLEFQIFSAAGYLNYENPSSLMYRREPILERTGFYDSVRTGADSEFKNRIELVFGHQAVEAIEMPLSFGLMHEQALTANSLGRGWFSHDRRVYRSSWRAWHSQIQAGEGDPFVPLDPDQRKFSIPASLSPRRAAPVLDETGAPQRREYDVVMISDYRMAGGNTMSTIEEMKCQVAYGLKTAICQVGAFRKGFMHKEFIDPKVQELVSAGAVDWIDLSDQVDAKLLTIRYPGVFQFADRMGSGVKADAVRVILNQPPSEKDSRDRRYDVADVTSNIQRIFEAPQQWAPIGPNVRESVIPFMAPDLLTTHDWFNIIHLEEWGGPRTGYVSDRPVIGRHSRDDYSKWPDTREDVFAAYPDTDEVRVQVLGGVKALEPLIGEQPPANWTVHPFNSLTPQAFLADVDFFVFFHHPQRVEAFGRTVIEAMAAGCVCILPRSFEPLFGDSPTYCEPHETLEVVRAIYADPERFRELSRRGYEFVHANFSYEAHIERLKSLGIQPRRAPIFTL